MEKHHRGTEGRRETRLSRRISLEVCVESVEDSLAAEAGGADRVELCANLAEGGTTPSAGMIDVVRSRLSIPVHVMVRTRSGDCCCSDAEFEVMRREVVVARERGADGVMFGILREDGAVDVERNADLMALTRPMTATFHRAFDLARDPMEALDGLIRLGFDRVLTSGQEATALAGAGLIGDLVRRAGGRIVVMPGGGLTEQNLGEIVRRTGVTELHASCASPVKRVSPANPRVSLGSAAAGGLQRSTDVNRVMAFVRSIRELEAT